MNKLTLELLATTLFYQLECRGIIKMQGKTVDEITENIKKAKDAAILMLTEVSE